MMGDLGKKLQEMGAGKEFADAVGYAEDIYSKVSMAYAAYSKGKEVLTYLGVLGKPEDPMAKISKQLMVIAQKLDQVLLNLEELKKVSIDASKLFTRTEVANEAADANMAAYNAKAYLEYPSDAQIQTDFDHARTIAHTAANRLYSNEYYWKRIFLQEALHEDLWSGVIYPDGVSSQGTSDGYIWDYRLALLVYLDVLICRSLVLLASSSEEKNAHWQEMSNYAQGLCERYMRIVNQIREVHAPGYQELVSMIPAMDDANFYVLDIRDNSTHLPLSVAERDEILRDWVPGGRWRLVGYATGVVEAWTGYACTVAYPQQELREGMVHLSLSGSYCVSGANMAGASVSVNNPEAFQSFYELFTLRHNLRTHAQKTRIYRELGLPKVLACIRYLFSFLGVDLAGPLPDYTVRSLREAFDRVPSARRSTAMVRGSISLRGMADVVGVSGDLSVRRILLMEENLVPV